MILFLIGYRGAGKSTIGPLLADRLGCPWNDSDLEIESRAGRTIPAIFDQDGEVEFRRLEKEAIGQLVSRNDDAGEPAAVNLVLSLGGGAVTQPEIFQIVRTCGRCIWLRADPEILISRLAVTPEFGQRPPLTKLSLRDEVGTTLQKRNPVYAECADYEIDTGVMTPAEAVENIARWLVQVDNSK